MVKLMFSYSTSEEKESFLSDILKLEKYRVLKVSKEYLSNGKNSYNKIYIDLSRKKIT